MADFNSIIANQPFRVIGSDLTMYISTKKGIAEYNTETGKFEVGANLDEISAEQVLAVPQDEFVLVHGDHEPIKSLVFVDGE